MSLVAHLISKYLINFLSNLLIELVAYEYPGSLLIKCGLTK